jgi:hypothetical protein
MKNIYLALLFIIPVVFTHAQADEKALLADMRDQLQYAFKDEKICNSLYRKFKDIKTNDPLLSGYIGGMYIARSRHVALIDKPSNFRTGRDMLEEAIKQKPGDIELIFLRMTVQTNLPSFLGYNDNIESDKIFVLNNYRTAPPKLRTRMVDFIKNSDAFSESEKAMIISH